MSKLCIDCKKYKTLDSFYKDSSRISGYRERCKSCHNLNFENYKKYTKICLQCGKGFKVTSTQYKSSRKKFCSKQCNSKFYIKKRNAVLVKHGMSHTHFYKKWCDINYRCNKKDYKNYGDRNIKCLWLSFDEFYNDMYGSYLKHINKYGELNTTIERLDVNGNYCKDNCVWATQKAQQRNRRNNRLIKFNNQTKCLFEWAEIYNIPSKTFWWRINSGWSIEKATSTPVRKNK